MSLYAKLGVATTFEELALRARARGEVAIGLQAPASEDDANWGIRINPWRERARSFSPKAGDRLIVLAEDDG